MTAERDLRDRNDRIERIERTDRADRAAPAWVLHPVVLVSVVVLLLNDHLLKAAWPGVVTGKLSDVAGLVLAPAVFTAAAVLVAPRLPVRTVAASVTAAVAVLFTLAKTTAAGAGVASAVWSWAYGPSVVLRDPTDLVALPALALTWWAFGRAQGHSVPGGAARVVRLLVVLPVATLAILATSAVDQPIAGYVFVQDGAVFVPMFGEQWVTSTDGETWRDVAAPDLGRLALTAPQSQARLRSCLPDDEKYCYQAVPGRLAVQETRDGGATWSMAWALSPGRQLFLSRAYSYAQTGETAVAVRGLAVLPVGGDHVVVVSAGYDGLVVRGTDGIWERRWFPTTAGRGDAYALPDHLPALTERGARIGSEYLLTTLAATLGLLLGGLTAARRAPGVPVLVALSAGMFALVVALGAFFLSVLEAVTVPAAQFVAVTALALWLIMVLCCRALSWSRAVLLAALAVGLVLAGMRPYVDWSSGQIDSHGVAARHSSVVLVAGLALMVVLGWGFRVLQDRLRPPAPQPDPVPSDQ